MDRIDNVPVNNGVFHWGEPLLETSIEPPPAFTMEADFSQKTSPVAALRGILRDYPLSVGILREIIQNSDDAGGTKQVITF
jgi:hypothetical protein